MYGNGDAPVPRSFPRVRKPSRSKPSVFEFLHAVGYSAARGREQSARADNRTGHRCCNARGPGRAHETAVCPVTAARHELSRDGHGPADDEELAPTESSVVPHLAVVHRHHVGGQYQFLFHAIPHIRADIPIVLYKSAGGDIMVRMAEYGGGNPAVDLVRSGGAEDAGMSIVHEQACDHEAGTGQIPNHS